MKSALRGKFTGFLAKLGLKFTGKTVGKFLGKAAFGTLDVAFGIWDLVDGATAIREGNSQAKEFRKAADAMVEAKNQVDEIFMNIKTRCDESNKKVTAETF